MKLNTNSILLTEIKTRKEKTKIKSNEMMENKQMVKPTVLVITLNVNEANMLITGWMEDRTMESIQVCHHAHVKEMLSLCLWTEGVYLQALAPSGFTSALENHLIENMLLQLLLDSGAWKTGHFCSIRDNFVRPPMF